MHGRRVDPIEIPGVQLLPAFHAEDDRGRFVKLHSDGDARYWQREHWAEIFYSVSAKGVVRGMHFQRPPDDHTKAVHCITGAAIDVVVDVRPGSPTEGAHAVVELTAEGAVSVVIPPGCAHGFQALADDTVMLYLVSTVHSPGTDGGIRFDSFGFEWPLEPVGVSERDRALPTLAAFSRQAVHGWKP
jgi:dTDP-4-dehydrorhamnose 3,5-epimerase